MAWGFFKKVADTAKQGAKVLKNTILPVAKQVYETAKPFIESTAWGKNIKKGMDYVEDVSDIVDSGDVGTAFKRGVDLYSRSKNYK